ncbi:MAG: hypothetical protein ACK4Q5_13695 [Saprospiraceae bacterium]
MMAITPEIRSVESFVEEWMTLETEAEQSAFWERMEVYMDSLEESQRFRMGEAFFEAFIECGADIRGILSDLKMAATATA